MVFKCKSCGGNVVYSPERHKMYCPYCDSENSEEKITAEQSVERCINCGGELHVSDYTSASRCPYCDNYLIFDERVSGEYEPHLILPFIHGKESVKKLMRDKFKKSVFAPDDFLSEVKLNEMTGMYVPFWMYDYHAHGHFDGQGNKVRSWRSGNKEYTETSIYHLVRDMEADFSRMPVDASDAMPDSTMDLMEPYDYRALEAFRAEYMSGFVSERYNADADTCQPRAVKKACEDGANIIQGSLNGFTMVRTASGEVLSGNMVQLYATGRNYALLPVWIYDYQYKNENYRFHINGQTGKIVGKVPRSAAKVWGYGATVFCGSFMILMLVRQLLAFL